jgi:hypothetical protein
MATSALCQKESVSELTGASAAHLFHVCDSVLPSFMYFYALVFVKLYHCQILFLFCQRFIKFKILYFI